MSFSFFALFLVVFVDLMGMMMIVPILPFYAKNFQASGLQIGLMGSTFAAFQLFASPLLGWVSDRYGRKRVLLFSQVGGTLGYILLGQAQTLIAVFVARAVEGATAGNIAVAQAYAADHSTVENRAKAFGVLGVGFGLGLLFGPALSGLLSTYSIHYPVYAAACLSGLSFFLTAVLLPNDAKIKRKESSAFFSSYKSFWNEKVGWGFFRFFCFVLAMTYFANGIALVASQRFLNHDGNLFAPKDVGLLFSFCGLIGILIQGVSLGALVKKFGERRLVKFAFLIDSFAYPFMGVVQRWIPVYITSSFFSVANSLLRPCLTSLISKEVDTKNQGAVLGLTSSLQSLAQIVAPPIGGYFIDGGHYGIWAFVLSGFSVIGLGSVFFGNKVKRGRRSI